MSNGYYIAAKVDTDERYIMGRECSGSYALDGLHTFELTDGTNSIFVSRDELSTLIYHLTEYLEQTQQDAPA